MVIAPRLDSAYLPHVLELSEFLTFRKKNVTDAAPVAMYGKGDFMVWALVVDPETQSMADLWHFNHNPAMKIYTTLDAYLMDGVVKPEA